MAWIRRRRKSGPKLLRDRLVEYLRHAVALGKLQIEDFELAADQFAELCRASYFPKLLCGVGEKISPDEREKVLEGAVEMFMARYGR